MECREPSPTIRIINGIPRVSTEYLSDPTLTLTVFAPTNDAWIKRLPTLTTGNGITVQQLFSESKSAALQSMLQYHILNTPKTVCLPLTEDHTQIER